MSWLGRAAAPSIMAARSADVMRIRPEIWTQKATLVLRDSTVPGRAVLLAVQGLL